MINPNDLKLIKDGLEAGIRIIDGLGTDNPPGNKLRTDRKPEIVPLLTIADEMIDPVFGTTIKRVTHDDGVSHRTQSAGNSWSSDSKHFVTIDTNGAVSLYSRDLKFIEKLTGFATEVSFSRELPNIIYGGTYLPGDIGAIMQYDINTKQYTKLVELRTLVPNLDAAGRTYIRGVLSANNKITVLFGGQSQDLDHYVYYGPTNFKGGILLDSVTRLNCHLHAIAIDLSGQFLSLGPTDGDINGPNKLAKNIIWDTILDKMIPMTVSAGGHGAMGYMQAVNNPDDADGMQYISRLLTTPNITREIISPYPKPPAFQMASHLSWCAKRDDFISATYRYGIGIRAPWREWDDEIIRVNLSGLVERLCHHRSVVTMESKIDVLDYWATPKPAAIPDGSGCLFTSNYGRNLGNDKEGARQDVFLVEIPS